MINIILFLLGIILGVITICAILIPKIKQTQKLDNEIFEKNEQLHTELLSLIAECASLEEKREQIKSNIIEQQQQSEKQAEAIYKKSFELANEKMDSAAIQMAAEFEMARQQAEAEYLSCLATNSEILSKELNATTISIKNAEAQLADLYAKVTAAVEAAKRQEEMQTAQDFYKLILPETDLDEIIKLKEVAILLRDSEPLNKVIWKVYYEKPCTDLIGRVVGAGIHTGIYKITNIENQKCYVGQAADIAARWKQHIKRGLGAEAPTRNKLYPAMQKYGVENFTFEIIEECPRDMLNDREDYWQEFFGAKEFGYSIK